MSARLTYFTVTVPSKSIKRNSFTTIAACNLGYDTLHVSNCRNQTLGFVCIFRLAHISSFALQAAVISFLLFSVKNCHRGLVFETDILRKKLTRFLSLKALKVNSGYGKSYQNLLSRAGIKCWPYYPNKKHNDMESYALILTEVKTE